MLNKTKRIPSLQYITENSVMGRTPSQQAELACKGGVSWVSLRTKGLPYEELLPIAITTKEICKQFGAIFIVSDNVLLAKEIDADGVHLGTGDIPIDQARNYLGEEAIIGCTANSFYEIKKAVSLGADYIALGPTRYSSSKKTSTPVIGPAKFLTIKRQCIEHHIDIPLIATGGVSPDDLDIFLQLGMHGIAVSSGINTSEDPIIETKEIIARLQTQSC